MNYKEMNKLAIEMAEETYGRLQDVEGVHSPNEVIHYLRTVLGLVCSKCGKSNISWSNLKYCNFDPKVMCYECQYN